MLLFNEVKKIVVNQLRVDDSKVKLESKFIDDLGIDSLDLAQLLMFMEDAFGINIIDTNYFQRFITIGDLVEIVEEEIKGKDNLKKNKSLN
ncbi:acyl carrier protein [bacterium]|nr:acyl carrier protein [bacterium]